MCETTATTPEDAQPKSLIEQLKAGRQAVTDKDREAKQARKDADALREQFLKDMRQALVGQKVRLTGWLSYEEKMGQDGFEFYRTFGQFSGEAYVTGVFYEQERFSRDNDLEVYLSPSGQVSARDRIVIWTRSLSEFELVEEPSQLAS